MTDTGTTPQRAFFFFFFLTEHFTCQYSTAVLENILTFQFP